jgi:hypothetical protein
MYFDASIHFVSATHKNESEISDALIQNSEYIYEVDTQCVG